MRSHSRILAFWLFISNANAPACKQVVNSARVCLVKNRFVVNKFISMEKFSITQVISQRIDLFVCVYSSSSLGWRYGMNGNSGSCRQPN